MPKEETLSYPLRRAREDFNVRVAAATKTIHRHVEEQSAVARARMTAAEVDVAERAHGSDEPDDPNLPPLTSLPYGAEGEWFKGVDNKFYRRRRGRKRWYRWSPGMRRWVPESERNVNEVRPPPAVVPSAPLPEPDFPAPPQPRPESLPTPAITIEMEIDGIKYGATRDGALWVSAPGLNVWYPNRNALVLAHTLSPAHGSMLYVEGDCTYRFFCRDEPWTCWNGTQWVPTDWRLPTRAATATPPSVTFDYSHGRGKLILRGETRWEVSGSGHHGYFCWVPSPICGEHSGIYPAGVKYVVLGGPNIIYYVFLDGSVCRPLSGTRLREVFNVADPALAEVLGFAPKALPPVPAAEPKPAFVPQDKVVDAPLTDEDDERAKALRLGVSKDAHALVPDLNAWNFVSVVPALFPASSHTRGIYLGLGEWELDGRCVRAYAVRGKRFVYLDPLPHASVEQWRPLLPGEDVLVYAGSDAGVMTVRVAPKGAT